VPLVHDESYLNWYWTRLDNQPTVTLSRAFKWPENAKMCDSAIVRSGFVLQKQVAKDYCRQLKPFIVEKSMQNKHSARKEGIDNAV
jgi:hypothetical protein